MLVQSFDPFNNIALSALIAAIPIVLFLLGLTLFKMKGINAALLTLVVTLIITLSIFQLPLPAALGGVIEGVVQGIMPIGYIIIMALWLYKVTDESGKFQVIQDSIASISNDQRIQLLLIGFCLNAFLEGAAGFGVPIAICAVLLVQLGFKPLEAAMLCLIANAASGAYGAIGIPVGIIDTLNIRDMTALDVSQMTAYTLPITAFIIPFLMIFILDGLKGIKEIFPIILITSVVFTGVQMIIIIFQGPELADILPSLIAMGVIALFCRKWQPKNIYRLNDNEIHTSSNSMKEIIFAWSPFFLLTAFILLWSLPVYQALFSPEGALRNTVIQYLIPGTYNASTDSGVMINVNFFGATGTAILLAVLLTIIFSKTIDFKEAFQLLIQTVKELWLSVLTICAILAIAKLMTYGGLTVTLGTAIAATGALFPLLSPVLGWIGVFMTGSVVNNNTLFASIQSTAGTTIGVNPTLLVAANTAGGVMAKLISPQSIAIATAAVKEVGRESELLSMTLKYSVALLIFVCIWTWVLSMIL